MSRLQKLKDKWFIDVNDQEAFPPQMRHKRALVSDYTDGNHLEPLIDGAALMAEFHNQLEMMVNSNDPSQWTLYLSAMNIHPVKLLGNSDPNSDVMARLLEAAEAGVNIYYLGSGHPGAEQVSKKFAKELFKKGGQGAADRRFPPAGGQHQKFTVIRGPDNFWLATLGSADFFTTNWDTPDHLPQNPERPKSAVPIHNLALQIQGPAIHDIALTFAERWNDEHSRSLTSPKISTTIDTTFTRTPLPARGSHSVQLLRTYGIQAKLGQSYSWSDRGEFTVWASYLNAVKRAEQYIYLEDQYLFPFGSKPYFERPAGPGRDSDIIYQLGEALKRGVDVIMLAPGRNDALYKYYEIQARQRGADYLRRIAESYPGSGRFIFSKLHIGGNDPSIHSKVMLVDDELALVGSTNVAQRSMCLCSEIHMAIVDEQDEFVRDLRLGLWSEHMELEDPQSIMDPRAAVGQYYSNALHAQGRLRLMLATRVDPELDFEFYWNNIIDPYSGPDRD